MFANLKKRPFIKMAALSTLIAEGVEITGDVVFHGRHARWTAASRAT